MSGATEGVGEWLRGYDNYGQAVTLNYQGDDTYKTIPGGILSLFSLICMFFYTILKLKYMLYKEEWELTQQTVVSDSRELVNPIYFSDLNVTKNISIGLQFLPAKPKQTLADKVNAFSQRQS